MEPDINCDGLPPPATKLGQLLRARATRPALSDVPEADPPEVRNESFMDFGAGGRDRTGKGFRPTDFRTTSAFAAGPVRTVRGLDYPFVIARRP